MAEVRRKDNRARQQIAVGDPTVRSRATRPIGIAISRMPATMKNTATTNNVTLIHASEGALIPTSICAL